jgi:hypothetical protein
MELLLKMKVENIFKAKDFVNTKTGETKPSKWKVQGFDKIETENGVQMKLIDVSITDDQYMKIKDKVGQEVTLPVGVYVNEKTLKHGYYGI